MKNKIFIIAEAGVNHNGNLETAFRLVEKAKEIGADCVKFQTFKAENIVTKLSPKASYQLKVTDSRESQFDMLKKLELQQEDFTRIKAHCDKNGIRFLSTPYNTEDIELLAALQVDAFKIASGQLAELPFLRKAARYGKKMILSTGMGTLSEVFDAVAAIKGEGNNDICVLQCNTDYPSDISDSNIKAMCTMRDAIGIDVGYSDHVQNNYACYAAAALGATIIEKHFTLDKKMTGPDHSCSLEPEEFKEMVTGIRNIELALGNGVKTPSASEQKNMFGMRRSLVAKTDLVAGTVLSEAHFAYKRPANGLSPNYIDLLIGKQLAKDISADEPFLLEYIRF